MGLSESDTAVAVLVTHEIDQALGEAGPEINDSLDQLPYQLRRSLVYEFAAPTPAVQDASPATLEALPIPRWARFS